jgi:hypothetical protein
MPPGTPGEFCAKAIETVAKSAPAVTATAQALSRTFMSIRRGTPRS